MTKNSIALRSVSAAAIVGLTLGMSPMALAQTTTTTPAAPAVVSTIDRTEGTLTIHKYGNPTSTGTPTGNIQDPAPDGKPLEGVVFTATEIELLDANDNVIKAGTNDWLAAAQGLTPATVQKWITDKKARLAASSTTMTTLVNGETAPATLKIGAYLVKETKPAPGYTPAADFIAFLPMTNTTADEPRTKEVETATQGESWNYNVHAYPKNYSKTQPVKEVVDKGQHTSGTYKYDITTKVRKVEGGKKLSYYWIEDTLDVKNLDVAGAKISVTIDGNDAAEGTDYNLTKNAATGNFVVKFTAKGLKNLNNQNTVVVHVEAVKTTNAGVVPNEAREWEPSNPTNDMDFEGGTPGNPDPSTESYTTPPVFTYSSGVEFLKVDGNRKGLEGAEFKVYESAPGAKDCSALDVKTAKAIDLNGAEAGGDVFVSGQGGKVSITGLHVNDFADNKTVSVDERIHYCLVETKAPKGKELLAEPIAFQLLASAETQTVTRDIVTRSFTKNTDGTVVEDTPKVETKSYTVPVYKLASVKVGANDGEVINLDDTTPNLPLTGGAGIGVLAAIGAALVGAGAWFARRNSKKA